MIAAVSSCNSKSVPGCNSIRNQLPLRATLLERRKRRTQAPVKLCFRDLAQLRLRIVNVININAFEVQVPERLLQLMLQVTGRHAMTADDEIGQTRDARFDKGLF